MKTKHLSILLILLSQIFFGQKKAENIKTAQEFFTVTSDSTKLFTRISGTGDLCIYVHGGPGMWSDSFENLKGKNLESRLKMVYYDQRGSGRSFAATQNNYSVDRMVEDIEDVRKNLGSPKVYLMSHSFGGIIATSYAAKYGENLKGLILVNSTLFLNNSVISQVAYANKLAGTKIEIKDDQFMPALSEAMGALNDKGLMYKLLTDSPKNMEILNKIDEKRPEENGFRNNVWSMNEYFGDFTKLTADIDIPVLVITGTEDHAVGPDHYKLFRFPNHKIAKIKGGHLLYFENNPEFLHSVFGFIGSKN
ncbi:proline iminopeptidase [Kaistella treverensis]|uniref:Proline iminopeptidase n=1 Tax=Kaistella treverensis TaxID=631455 RepID=A0A1I3JFQ9_9FLAO|nr:alpha/beta fold hydrolase [Kaistella treverensis]SFI59049.1 proline iminopeptidase [Kaistella treverensis]